ncbi:hypothetical protein BASA82_000050 [Batrachochytrium salamandrivorans]|nr:hypothetical protein BASA82_000050 [Batrachochytrium salamandrivorans]
MRAELPAGKEPVSANRAPMVLAPSVRALNVVQHVSARGKALHAQITSKRLLLLVHADVHVEVVPPAKLLPASLASKRLLPAVLAAVAFERGLLRKGLAANVALEGLLPAVRAHVPGQVRWGGKLLAAYFASQALGHLLLLLGLRPHSTRKVSFANSEWRSEDSASNKAD